MRPVIIFAVLFLKLYFETKAQVADSITINYQSSEILLKTSSPKTSHGSYYNIITQKLKAGNKLFVYCTSSNYTICVYIKSPSGKIDTLSDHSNSFPKSNSYCEFAYEAEETGNFNFYITSIEPHLTGAINITLAYTEEYPVKINPIWNTCEKLNFILNLSHTNFQLISTVPNQTNPNICYTVNCNLFNEAPATISGVSDPTVPPIYQTIYIKDVSLGTAKIIIKGVDEQIKKCLTNDWTIENTGNSLQEINYIQKGDAKYEFNKTHKQNNFKNKICLKIEPTGNAYSVVIKIY